MNFGLDDMNCYTQMPFMCTSNTRKFGIWERATVKINTDNGFDAVAFGNTDIPHPCNHTASQQSVALSSSIVSRCMFLEWTPKLLNRLWSNFVTICNLIQPFRWNSFYLNEWPYFICYCKLNGYKCKYWFSGIHRNTYITVMW